MNKKRTIYTIWIHDESPSGPWFWRAYDQTVYKDNPDIWEAALEGAEKNWPGCVRVIPISIGQDDILRTFETKTVEGEVE